MIGARTTWRPLRMSVWGAVLVLALLSPLGCILHCHTVAQASGAAVYFCDPGQTQPRNAEPQPQRPSPRAFYETLLQAALLLPALVLIQFAARSNGPRLRQGWLPPPTPPPRTF